MSNIIISVAKQYSVAPAGRYVVDGPYSGERFREEFLYPAITGLEAGTKVEVDLDGTLGYGSSFLDEAFGGLLREHSITLSEIRSKLTVISTRPMYEKKIWQYITDAAMSSPRA